MAGGGRNTMKRVLVYYRHFTTLGGAEFLPLTFISELQKTCDVTLALDCTSNVGTAMREFNIRLDLSKLKIVQVMPADYRTTDSGFSLSFYRFRRLKRLAKDADICISLANIMDFGKPAHHFLIAVDLGDKAFLNYVRNGAGPSRVPWTKRVRWFLLDECVRPLLGMRSKRKIISRAKEPIYPNSFYVENMIKRFYGPCNSRVFYPPTVFEFGKKDVPRNPLHVVYLGRIVPEKCVADIIGIVGRARALSGRDILLSIAGHWGSKEFKEEIMRLTSGKNWIVFPGEVFGGKKESLLLSATYAIHAMREEAFGISIAEYLKAGLIPVVPDEGGSCEVVGNPELSFRTNEEAADILVRLLDDPEFRERQRRLCGERAKIFSEDAFRRRQHDLLKEITGT